MKKIDKVTAFIVRQRAAGAELLLFRHPSAGVQLPAGTVELGESPEAAVLREAAEETGLQQLNLVQKLAVHKEQLPDDIYLVARMTKIFDSPTFDASSEGYGLTRGSAVEVEKLVDGFAAIVTDPLDFGQDPPVRLSQVRGYVRASLLSRQVIRHLFHLTTTEETAAAWERFDDGLNFSLFWTPLYPRPELNPFQSRWLEQVYEQLQVT